MKILVTGGSGYFGSLLLRKLLKNGYNCGVLDIVDDFDRPDKVKFFQADVRDYELVLNACSNIDIIYHNIAQVPIAKDNHLFDSVNITGTENILKAALKLGVKKVVYTSSSAVFGVPKRNPVTEETIPNPNESYGRAKYQGELICAKYVKKGLDVSIIRPRTILGHGRLGIFQILFEWICTGNNIPVLGEGNNKYQFVHADDLADACILAGERVGSSTYNCGTDRFGTMKEVLSYLCNYAGTGSKVKCLPRNMVVIGMKLTSKLGLSPLGDYHSLMYGRSMYFDITKARNELGWKPKYSNNEMFVESYNWYLQNRYKVISNNKNMSHHRSGMKQGILKLVKWVL